MSPRFIIDARGVAHRPGHLPSGLTSPTLEPYRMAMTKSAILELIGVGGRYAILAVAAFVMLIVLGIPGPAAGLTVVVPLAIFLYNRLERSHQQDAIIRFATSEDPERPCPCCAYRLVGLPPEEDGCVVCPECGAAWRVEPARDADEGAWMEHQFRE